MFQEGARDVASKRVLGTQPPCILLVPTRRYIKLSFLYPACTGRNMDEVMRALDSLMLAANHKNKIATPANWKPGEPVVISPSASDQEAKEMFPQGSKKGYLRFTNVE
ncbi:amino acid permease [Turnera subulata]|uniref:thioredoxin-dependent peroxiredoxin n=1 Tax=Turnera subulata TaxID=218843 RepID=A0A9Q0G053_9ROSI|nr:amino acid permease [Turnera subulata]